MRQTAKDLPGGVDQLIELIAGTDVEMAEPVEKLVQVGHRRIPEDFRLAVFVSGEPFGQVGDQLRQFAGERLLGKPDRLVESLTNPVAFLPIEVGIEPHHVLGRFDARKIPLDLEHAVQ